MAIRSALLGVVTACVSVAVCALLVEALCQAYTVYLKREWDRLQQGERHYYVRSDTPGLVYEVAPNRRIVNGDKQMVTNRFGLREITDSVGSADKCSIGLLGDSIVFGSDVSQDETIDAYLERHLADKKTQADVINLGTPGYGIEELHRYLGRAIVRFRLDLVVYILNLNDFARRDSIYEGADNGLYRMYRLPLFKSPWFVRKSIYRLKKGHTFASPAWYQWMFEGNKDRFLPLVTNMHMMGQREGGFAVAILPAGSAYVAERYDLQAVHDEITHYLRSHSVEVLDLVRPLKTKASQYFDATDHLTAEGDAAVAAELEEFIRPLLANSTRPACRLIGSDTGAGMQSTPSPRQFAGMN